MHRRGSTRRHLERLLRGEWPALLVVAALAFVALVLAGCAARPTAGEGDRAAPAPAPTQLADSDSDGVPDRLDLCPNLAEDRRWSTAADGCPDNLKDLVAFARADIDGFWKRTLEASGTPYRPPARVDGYTTIEDTACGETVPRNAFYCPLDNSIYFDTALLNGELNKNGDFGVVFIIAHEWGHLAQSALGVLGRDDTANVQLELQADCFAGAYARDAEARGRLQAGDLEEAGRTLFAAGDARGTAWNDAGAHGTSQQRLDAFARGRDGGVAGCLG
ncbi:MAG: neutral zinc metallopeptidase [Chloroflexi bacterium]|nr:neutral zinc metallopeptidase [Chloroflexota bacterium]